MGSSRRPTQRARAWLLGSLSLAGGPQLSRVSGGICNGLSPAEGAGGAAGGAVAASLVPLAVGRRQRCRWGVARPTSAALPSSSSRLRERVPVRGWLELGRAGGRALSGQRQAEQDRTGKLRVLPLLFFPSHCFPSPRARLMRASNKG